eukprot:jgi/Botrbrau1/2213/Bobra.101_2s0042.1
MFQPGKSATTHCAGAFQGYPTTTPIVTDVNLRKIEWTSQDLQSCSASGKSPRGWESPPVESTQLAEDRERCRVMYRIVTTNTSSENSWLYVKRSQYV